MKLHSGGVAVAVSRHIAVDDRNDTRAESVRLFEKGKTLDTHEGGRKKKETFFGQ